MISKYKHFFIALVFGLISSVCQSNDENTDNKDTKIGYLYENWPGRAIAYSGYRVGQDPRDNRFPSQQEVLEDLKILEKHWKVIRTYGADQHAVDILEVIQRENINLKVLLGIWLDGKPKYAKDNITQLNLGIQLANQYRDIVIAINVGNETQVHWSDHKVSQKKLVSFIKKVQQETDVPVTTADTWDYWLELGKSKKVIEAVDFIAAHIYPIWGGIDIDEGMEVTIKNFKSLQAAIPQRKIIITEAGWATYTVGELHAPNAGSEPKQARYFNELMNWSQENKIPVFWFEAFDEPWKGTGTEGHWGLFTAGRKPKLVMQSSLPNPVEKQSPKN